MGLYGKFSQVFHLTLTIISLNDRMTKPFKRPVVFNERVMKSFEWPDAFNKWVTKTFKWFGVSNERVTKSRYHASPKTLTGLERFCLTS